MSVQSGFIDPIPTRQTRPEDRTAGKLPQGGSGSADLGEKPDAFDRMLEEFAA